MISILTLSLRKFLLRGDEAINKGLSISNNKCSLMLKGGQVSAKTEHLGMADSLI